MPLAYAQSAQAAMIFDKYLESPQRQHELAHALQVGVLACQPQIMCVL